jgi:diguanylate cyclase (GGDEF)-like protein
MRIAGFDVFPLDDSKQEIRLKRFFIGVAAHVMNIAFVALCWFMGYFSLLTVLTYFSLEIAFVVIVYCIIRSGINKRFDDPSLTFVQIAIPAVFGLCLMYFAGEARSTFLLLGVTMFAFGMFRFKVRDFIALAIFILLGYAIQVALLYRYSSTAINLRFELLQWLAFAVTLAQFSFLANFIGGLRNSVVTKNQELEKQNIELENALKRIGDMAIRDELTGVYNRRYLMERIVEESQRCNRYGSTYCLCMLDIDFFKRVNDTYGHLAGDEVLRRVALEASRALRGTDFFGRFGGEEFIIALINTSMDGALIIANRVRQKIEDLTFDEIHQGLQITVSIGVAAHVSSEEPAQTLKRADDALYSAKDSGRNRCVVAELT